VHCPFAGLFMPIGSNKRTTPLRVSFLLPIFAKRNTMPELFRQYGFIFMFFSREHEPIHVHVRGHNGDAKFNWNGEAFVMEYSHNIK
jgi:hypothetical protein